MPDRTGSITDIRSIAVHAEDVVEAFEGNRRAGRSFVLRVNPPYHGRMRARIHDATVVKEGGGITVEPGALLDEEVLPPYPDPSDTEDQIRADPALEYTTELHHERHVERVRQWRADATRAIVSDVALPVEDRDEQHLDERTAVDHSTSEVDQHAGSDSWHRVTVVVLEREGSDGEPSKS